MGNQSMILATAAVIFYSIASHPSASQIISTSAHEQTCEEIGFTPKTPNFGNCVLELVRRESLPPAPAQQNTPPNYTQRGDGTPEDLACRNFGLQVGTSDYSTCRAQMAQLRIQQQQYELQVQQYQQQMAEVERERRRQRGLAMLQFGAGMANSRSPYFSDALAAGGRAVLGIAEPPAPQNPGHTVINLPGRRPMICSYTGNVINCN